ncbi:hypothetical protein N665_0149s0028 [Sinapis alba]|nr:hypothetical protein N665_0149s0028 [Sinapis alba]
MSQSTKNSSSSGPGSWRRRRGDRERGIPNFCSCGEEAVIKTSGTAKNPGRLFYCCPNGSEGDKFHLFTWTDERVVEDIEDLKSLGSELKGAMGVVRSDIVCLEKQIQHTKLMLESSINKRSCCCIL